MPGLDSKIYFDLCLHPQFHNKVCICVYHTVWFKPNDQMCVVQSSLPPAASGWLGLCTEVFPWLQVICLRYSPSHELAEAIERPKSQDLREKSQTLSIEHRPKQVGPSLCVCVCGKSRNKKLYNYKILKCISNSISY